MEIPHRLVDRKALFPTDIADECYVFGLITQQALLPYVRRAEVQAAILGDAAAPQDAEIVKWVFAEPSHPRFSVAIDSVLLTGGGTGLQMDQKGVTVVDGAEVFVETGEEHRAR